MKGQPPSLRRADPGRGVCRRGREAGGGGDRCRARLYRKQALLTSPRTPRACLTSTLALAAAGLLCMGHEEGPREKGEATGQSRSRKGDRRPQLSFSLRLLRVQLGTQPCFSCFQKRATFPKPCPSSLPFFIPKIAPPPRAGGWSDLQALTAGV